MDQDVFYGYLIKTLQQEDIEKEKIKEILKKLEENIEKIEESKVRKIYYDFTI